MCNHKHCTIVSWTHNHPQLIFVSGDWLTTLAVDSFAHTPVNTNWVWGRNKHQEKTSDNQVSSSKLPVQKVHMTNNHVHYCIEGNPKNCSQRYEQWEGISNTKIDAKVENDSKCRASADEAPWDVSEDLHMQEMQDEDYGPEGYCRKESNHWEKERHLVEAGLANTSL